MPARIPLPTDDELTPEHREMLTKVPPLNVFRMVAGTRRGLRPFLQLGAAALTSSMDARRREIAVLRVAHATSAGYERAQHERLARLAGVTEEEIAAIAGEEPVTSLDEEANLICRVADEVSRGVRLSDEALTRLTAYKLSKAAINALSQSLAIDNAAHGIRVNTIMPGLLDTPMAVDARAAHSGVPREQVVAGRAAAVPLRAQMGTGWDVAYASLFLHSDEAQFITGAVLPVDGGQLARVGG